MLKHIFDLLVSAAALVALSPLLLVLAILVRRRLGSPVLFRQARPGLVGEPFTILKFRTMTDDCDEHGILIPAAERLTPFGRTLRRTSLGKHQHYPRASALSPWAAAAIAAALQHNAHAGRPDTHHGDTRTRSISVEQPSQHSWTAATPAQPPSAWRPCHSWLRSPYTQRSTRPSSAVTCCLRVPSR